MSSKKRSDFWRLTEGDLQRGKDHVMRMISPEPNTGCWLWLGSITACGYGNFMIKGTGVMVLTHRLMSGVDLTSGRKLHVDHLCHQPLCCNPEHLKIVTPANHRKRHLGYVGPVCPRGHDTSVPGGVIREEINNHTYCAECFRERRRALDRKKRRENPEYVEYHREACRRSWAKNRERSKRHKIVGAGL